MSPEKTKALYDEFPELYREKDLNPRISSSMFRGFECDDGWFNIIHELSTLIARYVKWNQCSVNNYPIAIRIKEKFGGLRFHCSTEIKELHGAICMIEQMSFITCECCGNLGQECIRRNWTKTLCSNCAFNNDYTLCVREKN